MRTTFKIRIEKMFLLRYLHCSHNGMGLPDRGYLVWLQVIDRAELCFIGGSFEEKSRFTQLLLIANI